MDLLKKKESKKDKEKKSDDRDTSLPSNGHQAIAVIGISLIAMNEEIGANMALRAFSHLLHYGRLFL